MRIDVGLLDRLLSLAGELLMARNRLAAHARPDGDPAVVEALGRLDGIAAELQAGVMAARMQPIAALWGELPRVVRDLAVACGKRVHLVMEGQETELDRAILDALKDPLIHAVRNAVDHGIEPPDVRGAAGKPAEGRLTLRASYQEGHVRITIDDDGAGIDPGRVGRRAIERGLIDPEQAGRLGDRALLDLIFLPGFSTADRVTHVSGRGVGMDVVKAGVERAGGVVALRSRPGRGTTLEMTIPLTLAIMPTLIVGEGGGRFAVPRTGLLEVLRVDAGRDVEWFHGAPVFRLRGRILPLVDLGDVLRRGDGRLVRPEGGALVVLRAEGRDFGLLVDRVHDVEEVVVKPLPAVLGPIPIYAGASILGDGTPTPILDPAGIARASGLANGAIEAASPAEPAEVAGVEDVQTLLILGLGAADGRLALPIDRVVRLENVPVPAVERVDGREVLNHQGRVISLIRLGGPVADAGPLKVAVCTDAGRRVGLVVDRVLDVVDAPLRTLASDRADGLLGVAVIGGRVTGLLDLPATVRAADPRFFGPIESDTAGVGGGCR